MLNQRWNGILTHAKPLHQDPEIEKMNDLTAKDMSIKRNQLMALSMLDEMARLQIDRSELACIH